jgi:predicted nuclease of predicted toxin-antitoxin system
MRILIDECLDWRLGRAIPQHRCLSVRQMGWQGLTNGFLLQKAQKLFDVFLTGDTNLMFQQNLTTYSIAVVVIHARSTRLVDTTKLMPQVSGILKTIEPGQVVRVRLTTNDRKPVKRHS